MSSHDTLNPTGGVIVGHVMEQLCPDVTTQRWLGNLCEPPLADPHEGWCALSITHKSQGFYRRASSLKTSILASMSCSMSFRNRA